MKRIDRIIAIINDVRNGIAHPEVELIETAPGKMVPGRIYTDVSDINIATAMQLDNIQYGTLWFKNNETNIRYDRTYGLVGFTHGSSSWYYVKIKKI